jgi:hypothetical protein
LRSLPRTPTIPAPHPLPVHMPVTVAETPRAQTQRQELLSCPWEQFLAVSRLQRPEGRSSATLVLFVVHDVCRLMLQSSPAGDGARCHPAWLHSNLSTQLLVYGLAEPGGDVPVEGQAGAQTGLHKGSQRISGGASPKQAGPERQYLEVRHPRPYNGPLPTVITASFVSKSSHVCLYTRHTVSSASRQK